MVVFVTAGGTGGHIFPGLALYGELAARGHNVLFVGADRDRRFESIERLGNRFVGFPVEQLYRRKPLRNIPGFFRFMRSLRGALALIRGFRPDVCVGMGGFASAPLLLACCLRRIPYCIAEQNAVPGRANRWLARKAAAVMVNFRQALDLLPRRIRARSHLTGNPVRPGFGTLTKNEARKRMGLAGSGPVLGVTGGSQGAAAINAAIAAWAAAHKRVTVLWSCGKNNAAAMDKAVDGCANVRLFPFVDDMAAFLQASDLVVSRAGATSLAELAACASPAILVPYPWAADDHQTQNARACAEAGAALVVAEGPEFAMELGTAIDGLLRDRKGLDAMRKAAGRLHDPATLGRMADIVERVARERSGLKQEEGVKE